MFATDYTTVLTLDILVPVLEVTQLVGGLNAFDALKMSARQCFG